MIVRIAEIDPICAMQACMDGYEVVSPYLGGINDGTAGCVDRALLGQLDLVVTATGNMDVCDRHMLAALKNACVVCNIGHFDHEIDTAFMRRTWEWEEVKPQVHKIHRDRARNDYLLLLSEGRLVNLGNATGHPSRIMDGSFANQVLAQIYLYERRFADLEPELRGAALSIEVLPKKLDEEVARHMVAGFGGVLTRLRPEQADYIKVSVDGPFKNDQYRY
jgi:adenosylhomocysteinase